jgi:hypothetical protein
VDVIQTVLNEIPKLYQHIEYTTLKSTVLPRIQVQVHTNLTGIDMQ